MQPRLLQPYDYEHNFLDLLSQLTTVGDITEEQFIQILKNNQNNNPNSTHLQTYVIQDPTSLQILATASLLIEQKFIHSCGKVGHIEDVVVDSNSRGMGLGKIMINHLVNVAKKAECYKVILDCNESNVSFYQKCDFEQKEIMMAKYF